MSQLMEQIQEARFRMARRKGYEVSDVDEFLDRIGQQVAALIAENDQLREQNARLGGGTPPG